jgi:hypothetical protein
MDFETLARLTGQKTASNGPTLARLTINREDQDADKNEIPMGTYAVKTDKGVVYSKTATFRPFLNTFQYMVYDAEAANPRGGKGMFTNKTVLFQDFSDEAPDELGGVRCGKIQGKAAKENMTEKTKLAQKNIMCYRNMYGLVSLVGKTATGEEVTVTEMPVLWRTRGSAFMPISDALEGLNKRSKLMILSEFKLTTERKKNGGTIYYVPVLEVDALKSAPFTPEHNTILTNFGEVVASENKAVVEKHKSAIAEKTGAAKEAAAMKTINASLDDDFADDLPEDFN